MWNSVLTLGISKFQQNRSKKVAKGKNGLNVVFASGRLCLNVEVAEAGGGVLLANCFCHWLPEVREGLQNTDIDS